MSTDVIGRDPLDDPLLAELRTMLDEVEATPDGWPSTMPPWEQISAGMKQVRRRRRVRRAGKVATGVLAVTLAGAGVMTGVVPYPSFAPTITMPSAPAHSALYRQPVRGSLAADGEWLAGFRAQVAAEPVTVESGGERWSPPAEDKVRVLYAGDLGRHRIALVEGDWRSGPLSSPQQVWFEGPEGAQPAAMTSFYTDVPTDTPVQIVRPKEVTDPQHPAASAMVLVLSARPVTVQVQGSPAIDARARVSQRLTTLRTTKAGEDSVLVTSPGNYRVLVAGRTAFSFVVQGDQEMTTAVDETLHPVWRPLRGGANQTGSTVNAFASPIWDTVLQPYGSGSFRLLVGPSSTSGQPIPVNPIVGLVKLPGGARVVGMGGQFSANASVTEFDTTTLIPAGNSRDVAVAWRSTPAEFHDRPTWTAAMGPVGTVRVEWHYQDGSVSTSDAQDTLAVVVRDDVRSVLFLDAAGKELASRPVLKPIGITGVVAQVRA